MGAVAAMPESGSARISVPSGGSMRRMAPSMAEHRGIVMVMRDADERGDVRALGELVGRGRSRRGPRRDSQFARAISATAGRSKRVSLRLWVARHGGEEGAVAAAHVDQVLVAAKS